MSGSLPPVVEGPRTRSRAVGSGATPPLSTSASAPSVATGATGLISLPTDGEEFDDEEDAAEAKHDFDPDAHDYTTEVEFDEETDLLEEDRRLRAEEAVLKAQRVALLRLSIERRSISNAVRRAELSEAPSEVPVVAAIAPMVEQTPARSVLRPRHLGFQSTVGRRAPTAAALAHRASIDELPDAPLVSVAVIPAVVGGGSVSAPITTTAVVLPAPDAAPPTPAGTRPNRPQQFTGDDSSQNKTVDSWVENVNSYLRLSRVAPTDHLDFACSYMSPAGGVGVWLKEKRDEVRDLDKQMTWEWLQTQMVNHYKQPAGVATVEVQWERLVMGTYPQPGKDDGTRTVRTYTNQFLFCMRQLTDYTTQTTNVLVRQRYLQGIKHGYLALYNVMLGTQPVLRCETLQEAIELAELAEADIGIRRVDARPPATARRRGRVVPASGVPDAPPPRPLTTCRGSTATRRGGRRRRRPPSRARPPPRPNCSASASSPILTTAATSCRRRSSRCCTRRGAATAAISSILSGAASHRAPTR
jgi:hypothetical protein